MAQIVQLFAGDNAVQLGTEDIVRQMPWGTNWQKIRVGCRLAVNTVGSIGYIGTISPNPRVGICTGPEAVSSYVTTDAVAFYCINTAGMNYNAGTGGYSYLQLGPQNMAVYQKTGNTFNYGGSYVAGTFYASAAPAVWRCPWYVDFIKQAGGTTLSVTVWCASVIVDCTRGDFLLEMESEFSPANTVGTQRTATLTRTANDWDSMFVGWCRSATPMLVYDMTVVRYY